MISNMKPITQVNPGDTVMCIKEWKSRMFPEKNYGVLGEEYKVTEAHVANPIFGRCYLMVESDSVEHEWLNVERFVITKDASAIPKSHKREEMSDREWSRLPANLREGCTVHVKGVGDI